MAFVNPGDPTANPNIRVFLLLCFFRPGSQLILFVTPAISCIWSLGARLLVGGSLHSVLIQGSVVVIRQFLIFINQTFLMVSVALVTMVDWRVHLFSCLGPLLGPLGGPEGALEAPKMPKITISCFDYRNAPKWVEQGPKIGWTLQNTFRGVC